MQRRQWSNILGYSLLGLALILVPLFLSQYLLHLLIVIALNIILALSIRFIFVAGELTVGHAAFMGIGAYTSALLATRLGFSFWLGLLLAAVVAGLIAAGLGFLTLRVKIRGLYFAIVTLAFAEVFRLVVTLWKDFTGGATGVLNILRPAFAIPGLLTVDFSAKLHYYYLAAVLAFLTWVIMSRLEHSRFGLTLTAVRESDVLAESVGIDVVKYKTIAFAIGSAFAGVAGSFLAHYYHYVGPYEFTLHRTLYMVLYAMFGGIGSLIGPVLGASILTIIPEVFRIAKEYEPAIFGIILILTIWLLPEGLTGLRKYISLPKIRLPARR